MNTVKKMSCFVLALTACAERSPVWDAPPPTGDGNVGLRSALALLDPPASRVLMVTVDGQLAPHSVSLPLDHGYRTAAPTADGNDLLVLCHGDAPRQNPGDQRPSLTRLRGGPTPAIADRYELSDPLSALTVDPSAQFAVVSASENDVAFVTNPNELLLVDLARPPASDNPQPRTLRSFGGRPRAFTFTPPLALPGGPRRLLVARTDSDLSIVDLSDPAKPDITVRLTGGTQIVRPADIAVSDGEPERDNDARLAVRLQEGSDLVIIDFVPTPAAEAATSPHSYRPVPNVVAVGGPATDIAFVKTDGGLRVAAPIPSRRALALVDPATGTSDSIDLGASFEHLAVVTPAVGSTDGGGDVALLWSSSQASVAFVRLGVTSGTPYRSVERLTLSQPVAKVLDVPAPNEKRKVLVAKDGVTFVVLDLPSRTASPLLVGASGTTFGVSADGVQSWIFSRSRPDLALVDFATLHPKNLRFREPIQNVFDVQRTDGGRALLALHRTGAGALSVLDPSRAELSQARYAAGLFLGELP